MALMASEMPLTISSPSLSQEWPFLCATTAATTALISSATCSGPVAASIPNSTIDHSEHDDHEDQRDQGIQQGWGTDRLVWSFMSSLFASARR